MMLSLLDGAAGLISGLSADTPNLGPGIGRSTARLLILSFFIVNGRLRHETVESDSVAKSEPPSPRMPRQRLTNGWLEWRALSEAEMIQVCDQL
jgi:hypothetical protein